jgi:DNA-directed RNA polymerase subunit RPC12/RpoP
MPSRVSAGGNMAKLTCPKCKMELNEVLDVEESVVELEDDNFYLQREPIMTTIKCTRCGSTLQQSQIQQTPKIACPNCPSCGMRLDVGIGVMESVMEYNENEEWYLNAKEVSLPKITKCLHCGADLRNIDVRNE